MTIVIFNENKEIGAFVWEAAEDFSEIKDRRFELPKMTAVEIESMTDLSVRSKILLSGVAGAVWQCVCDNYPFATSEAINFIRFEIIEED